MARFLPALVLAVAGCVTLPACGDRSNAATADGGDAALLARRKDAGHEGGVEALGDGGTTDDLAIPQVTSDELLARMRHLLEAVAQSNPELAGDALFPRDAYIASRDSLDPQKAWEKRVSAPFRRSVERTHKRTKGIQHAKFVGFELGHSIVQLTPKKSDFKKALWRVKHSKLTFTVAGEVRHLDIAEMTAWRGSWYVTRLR